MIIYNQNIIPLKKTKKLKKTFFQIKTINKNRQKNSKQTNKKYQLKTTILTKLQLMSSQENNKNIKEKKTEQQDLNPYNLKILKK